VSGQGVPTTSAAQKGWSQPHPFSTGSPARPAGDPPGTVEAVSTVQVAPAGRRVLASPVVRAAAVVAVLALVLGLTAHELRSVDWLTLITGVQWWAVGVAALATAVSVLGAAWNLVGFSPVPLRTRRAVAAQLAGSALKVVTPASVGTVAVNARVVQRSGTTTGPALVTVAATQAAQLLMTAMVLLGLGMVSTGGQGTLLPDPRVSLGVVGAGAVLAVTLALTHRWWWSLLPPGALSRTVELAPHLVRVVREPRRCLAGFGGCLLLTGGLAAALWASVTALGGELTLLAVLVVLLAGSAVGSSVPTPGGVGGVEAAMATGLVTAGLPLAQAVPAVVLYRVLTFWLLVPPGLLAAAGLRRRQLL